MKPIFRWTSKERGTGRRVFNLIFALVLVLAALGKTTLPASAGGRDHPRIDPRLLQMATGHPDASFNVIVQREVRNKQLKDDAPETEIGKGGGRIKKQMRMIESFSAVLTGKAILKLAKNPKVRWISADAPMASTAGPGMDTVRDEFTDASLSENDGTAAWGSDWVLSGDSADATSGPIQVVSDPACAGGSGNCLRLDPAAPTDASISRQADLSGTVSVWLSLYRDNLLTSDGSDPAAQVQLQVSSDGGANWTNLQTYSGSSNPGAATDRFDISTYASASTQIRFWMPACQCTDQYIYFDDIEIAFAYPSVFLSTVKANLVNLDGQGVTVAVVDSGIAHHPDFQSGDQTRIIYDGFFGSQSDSSDQYGHGTHVAGILAGSGAASNGEYRGVAPGVNLIDLKVSDQNGMTYESSLIDAMGWIYNNRSTYNIRVVNISVNSTIAQSYQTSALDAAVETLWFSGIVVVVSSGNNGTGDGPVTVYPPANDPFVITVGATEDKGTPDLGDDSLTVFSAYGTTPDGFAKPDLVAPGRNLIAALAGTGATMYTDHAFHRVNDDYFRMSGTSMSAPVVSGAVALLLQSEPDLNPDQIKYRLMATANQTDWNFDPAKAGAGILDIYAAVNGTTTESANTGIPASQMLTNDSDPTSWNSVGWNTVGWNTVGWNTVGWNTVGWNTVGWNTVGWNTSIWDDER